MLQHQFKDPCYLYAGRFLLYCLLNSCYNFDGLKNTVKKAEADQFCEQIGGHVIAPETKDESEFVFKKVMQTPGKSWYHAKTISSFLTENHYDICTQKMCLIKGK